MFVRFWFHDGSCVMYCALDEVDSSVVSCSTHLLGVYDQKYLQVSEHWLHSVAGWSLTLSRCLRRFSLSPYFNPLIATLTPHNNGSSYSNSDWYTGRWWVHGLLHLVQRWGNWAGPQPAQAPPRCTECNSLSVNGQCSNSVLFDVAL